MIAMSDVDILHKKTAEIRSLKIFNAVLTIATLLLVSGFIFTVVVSRLKPPAPQPEVTIVKNNKVTVPSVVTAGESFQFHSEGEKLVPVPAEIKVQLNCQVGDAENIVQVGQYSSNRPVGKYKAKRTFTVAVSQKLKASDDCQLHFYNYYTLYQTDSNGDIRQITVPVITKSNTFKLLLPDNFEDIIRKQQQSQAVSLNTSRTTTKPTAEPTTPADPPSSDQTQAASAASESSAADSSTPSPMQSTLNVITDVIFGAGGVISGALRSLGGL